MCSKGGENVEGEILPESMETVYIILLDERAIVAFGAGELLAAFPFRAAVCGLVACGGVLSVVFEAVEGVLIDGVWIC